MKWFYGFLLSYESSNSVFGPEKVAILIQFYYLSVLVLCNIIEKSMVILFLMMLHEAWG